MTVKKLRVRRPSPALIVAFTALFVSLTGTGYAVQRASVGSAQLKRNAVTKTKIKKNAVTASKLKKNSVTTPKMKKNAVTGDKVLESSLGKVPDSDKLEGNRATAFEKSSKFIRLGVVTAGDDETKELYRQGPFTLKGKCELNFGVGPSDLATITIATTQAKSSYDGEGTEAQGGLTVGDFGPSDGDMFFVAGGGGVGEPGIQSSDDGMALAPDGTQFVAQVWAGTNLMNQPGRCQFGGLIVQTS